MSAGPSSWPRAVRSRRPRRRASVTCTDRARRWRWSCAVRGRPSRPTSVHTCSPSPICSAPPQACRRRESRSSRPADMGEPESGEPGLTAAGEPPIDEVPLLGDPAAGLPEPITTAAALAEVVEAVRTGTGPIALDAERASGYRYSQRAYLVQLRRAGVGTVLIDPIELPDLRALGQAMGDAEWILHAANQDLPCLAE